MASFKSILGHVVGDIANVLIPGADPFKGYLTGPKNGDSGLPGAVTRVLGSHIASGITSGSYGVTGERESTLGPFEVLVPDPIEEILGTMPATTNGNGCVSSLGDIVVPTVTKTVNRAPNRNYVVVECPRGSGRKVAMRKEVARSEGYWRPRRKPPISVTDWRALMKAERTAKKLDRVVQASNRVVGKARYRRSSGASRSASKSRK